VVERSVVHNAGDLQSRRIIRHLPGYALQGLAGTLPPARHDARHQHVRRRGDFDDRDAFKPAARLGDGGA
jgi:hypothetical protein